MESDVTPPSIVGVCQRCMARGDLSVLATVTYEAGWVGVTASRPAGEDYKLERGDKAVLMECGSCGASPRKKRQWARQQADAARAGGHKFFRVSP